MCVLHLSSYGLVGGAPEAYTVHVVVVCHMSTLIPSAIFHEHNVTDGGWCTGDKAIVSLHPSVFPSHIPPQRLSAETCFVCKTHNSIFKILNRFKALLLTYGIICSPRQLLPAIQSLAKNKFLTTGYLPT